MEERKSNEIISKVLSDISKLRSKRRGAIVRSKTEIDQYNQTVSNILAKIQV